MAIPLPRVVADVEAGGPLVTSLRGINALTNSNLENQIKSSEAQYAPITTLANAASKMAYSNYMQPQYMAKILNNPDIVANMSPQQRAMALQIVNSPATMNPFAMANSVLQNKQPGFLERAVNGVRNAFFPNQQPQQSNPPQNNALMTNPVQDNQGVNSGYSYDNQGRNIQASPQEIASIANQGNGKPSASGDYFENAGEAAGVKEEGKEKGKIRAQDIKEYGDIFDSSLRKEATLNNLAQAINTPEFQQIRQLPVGQRQEIGYYAKFGTPQQQRIIGKFLTDIGEVVKDSASDFKGQFRKGEQTLLNSMKVNDSDSIDVARGKLESLMLFNSMIKERARMVTDLMENKHMSKVKALKATDHYIKSDKIARSLEDKINPQITIKNSKTGQTITVPMSEARSKYGINR